MTPPGWVRRLAPTWPRVRATLVTLHCAAIALAAVPAPTPSTHVITPDDPSFPAEVHPWAKLFGMSDAAFARRAEAARSWWADRHAWLASPFERYLALIGARQPWSLFSSPNRWPARFELDLRTVRTADDDGWRLLSGLPPGSWRRSFFESERVRSLLNGIVRSGRWQDAEDLCVYVARRALDEHRAAAQARCLFVATATPSWRVAASEGPARRVIYSRVIDRDP